jgi:hypothetical protein
MEVSRSHALALATLLPPTQRELMPCTGGVRPTRRARNGGLSSRRVVLSSTTRRLPMHVAPPRRGHLACRVQ